MVNMSVEFGERTHNGVVSIVFHARTVKRNYSSVTIYIFCSAKAIYIWMKNWNVIMSENNQLYPIPVFSD